MNIKDTVAQFQMTSSRIASLNIDNEILELPSADQCNSTIGLGNPKVVIKQTEKGFIGVLLLIVETSIERNSDKKKLDLSITAEGTFTYDGKDQAEFENMLFLNGNSALYSIIRSYVISVTSLSLVSGKIVLPMINFLKVAEKLKTEETK